MCCRQQDQKDLIPLSHIRNPDIVSPVVQGILSIRVSPATLRLSNPVFPEIRKMILLLEKNLFEIPEEVTW